MEVFEKVDGVAKMIGVSPSTVKKYYLLFEEEGYRFTRSQDGHILFSSHDVGMLKELVVIKNQPGMTVQKAVKKIVASEVMTNITGKVEDMTDITKVMMVMSEQINTVMSDMTHLKEMLKEQNEVIKNQQKLIDDRDQAIAELVITSKGTQKLLLDSKNEKNNNELQLEELRHITDNHTMLNEIVLDKLKKQQEYLEDHLEQRDKKLMESIRQSQEERKALLQLAAAQEEEKKKRKGIFKFFSKG